MSTAIITGGGKRVGQSISLFLATLGYNIIITYKDSLSEAEKTKIEVEKSGRKCHLIKCDLSDISDVRTLIEYSYSIENDVSLLINNASVFNKNDLKDTTDNQLLENYYVNFFSPYILTRDFANVIQKGTIINIIDSKAEKNGFKYSAYTLSKKSLFDLTYQSAVELGPDIRVNGIAPGFVLAPENDDADYFARLSENNPLHKSCSLDDINNSIKYILTNTFVTGQIMYLDGGKHLVTGE
ncbi:MAG: hypothetical protein A2015_10910 [Spirochaetes bacterium GWF1_31_7]|nr:MAG: hypothetical protein A2Y30_13045 [Spirochaetes bacterium GWE1_32_154]OHD48367.1 MAG: hypothetical protein A2015_10910 [Spirochaetes bacterium GWF1_31_7]OHD50460.1 MAG: hypothetical protein A2Y29_11090 [Spirochaetes bacterium GWE2_31_10]OHD81598.1 MAG: hypothetical protein A2355_17780 [Spirochaetes bacterium RIFOXYB1_FULL_32_8]HBD96371.1 short-chain dehydrogenase [Spirochaetia bacterium]